MDTLHSWGTSHTHAAVPVMAMHVTSLLALYLGGGLGLLVCVGKISRLERRLSEREIRPTQTVSDKNMCIVISEFTHVF